MEHGQNLVGLNVEEEDLEDEEYSAEVANVVENDEEEDDINAEFQTEDGEEVLVEQDVEEESDDDVEINNSEEVQEHEIDEHHEVINNEEVELAQEDVHEEEGVKEDDDDDEQEAEAEDDVDVASPDEASGSPVDNKEDSNQSSPMDDANDSNSDDDFDNVVEVEEVKQDGVGESEIVSDGDDDKQDDDNEEKLGEVSDDDLRGASDSEDEGVSPSKRRNRILSDEEDDNTNRNDEERKSSDAVMKMFDSDSENEEKEEGEGVGELIADIFGESDEEEEEFTGFGQEEVPKGKAAAVEESSSEDEAARDIVRGKVKKPKEEYHKSRADSDDEGGVSHQMSDFDLMMAEKKAQTSRRRKHRDGGSLISDADDQIIAMLGLMKEAAEQDRLSNQKRQPALKKMKILPRIMTQLKKQDLREAFVDNGLIMCIADWLSPLPDRSLPHLSIRTEFLTCLHGMPPIGPQTLKHSGIGRAVMYLYKHPKEIRKNKDLAGRLINKWSRPIFGINENYKCLSREERELRDLEQMPQAKRRRLSAAGKPDEQKTSAEPDQLSLRPGEEGFVLRARVPMPSTRDYVVRPKSRIELDPGTIIKDRKKKKDERLDKHIRNFADRKKRSKITRAVKISLEGNKMGI